GVVVQAFSGGGLVDAVLAGGAFRFADREVRLERFRECAWGGRERPRSTGGGGGRGERGVAGAEDAGAAFEEADVGGELAAAFEEGGEHDERGERAGELGEREREQREAGEPGAPGDDPLREVRGAALAEELAGGARRGGGRGFAFDESAHGVDGGGDQCGGHHPSFSAGRGEALTGRPRR